MRHCVGYTLVIDTGTSASPAAVIRRCRKLTSRMLDGHPVCTDHDTPNPEPSRWVTTAL